MRLWIRILFTVGAMAIVFAMGVHYDTAEEEHWPYPTTEELASDYEANVGEPVLLFGTVESIDPADSTAEIRMDHDEGTMTITARDFHADVEPGGTVQLLGTVDSERSLHVERVVVVNRTPGAEITKFVVSGIGAFVFLVAFFRQWRVDLDAIALESR